MLLPLLRTLILLIAMFNYIFITDKVVSIIVYIVATGIALNIAFARKELLADKTWMIMLSSTAYVGLSLMHIIPPEISLLISLIILLGLLGLTNSNSYQGLKRQYLLISMVIVIGFIGIVIGVNLLPWIIISPFIESMLLSNRIERKIEYAFTGLYFVTLYGLSMIYSPILIIFMFLVCGLRIVYSFFRSYDFLWLDSLLRIVFLVIPIWM